MRFKLPFVTLCLGLAASASTSPELVDRIVAIIDQEVITLSQAERAQRIGEMRFSDDVSLREVVDRLIERRLVAREVGRLSTEPVPETLVESALVDVKEGFASPEDFRSSLAQYGLSEADVRQELREQLRTTRYLDKRFRALTFVSEDEVARFFEEELVPGLPEGMPVPERGEYEEEIKRIIEERKFNDRVDTWIEELSARASIRRYVW